jgi:hypothetical protein
MVGEETSSSRPAAPDAAYDHDPGPARDLARIGAAVDAARDSGAGRVSSTQFLVALALLRDLREHIASWEPELIDAARSHGVSWADLAPALGVASRQAAERRALRLRPSADGHARTGDQRVRAERDRRAGQRAVDAWAREHAADLRALAGQVGALEQLPPSARGPLRTALGHDDPAALLGPLADARPHLPAGHPALAEQIDQVTARTTALRGPRGQRPGAGRLAER